MELLRVGEHLECRFRRRLNRFVVEVELSGETVRAHINNTGRLVDVLVPGARGFLLPLPRAKRLRYRLFSVWYNGGYSVLDTGLQERAFAAAVERGALPWARGCRVLRRSPRVGSARFDYELDCPEGRTLVETKSAVLRSPEGLALYPDTVSLRGREHVRLLARLAREGVRVLLVFIAAFPGARGFRPHAGGDPEMPGLVRMAVESGVLVRSMGLEYRPRGRGGVVYLYNPDLPVIL